MAETITKESTESTTTKDSTSADKTDTGSKTVSEQTDAGNKSSTDDQGSAHYSATIEDPSESFSRDQWILSHIKDEDLMEYLRLEQQRLEFLQNVKEKREQRIYTLIQLLLSLAAVIAVTYLLKDNPTILLSILYIVGIIGAFWIMKHPKDKNDTKNSGSNS